MALFATDWREAPGRDLPRAAGWVDGATETSDGWRLAGWALSGRGEPFDALWVHWNGRERGLATRVTRADLEPAFYWQGRAPEGGFEIELGPDDDRGRLDLVGERHGHAVAGMSTTFCTPGTERFPLPPDDMSRRVSNLTGDSFRMSGLKAATDMSDAIRRHLPRRATIRLLDWGCGCGRVARYMADWVNDLSGCDVDGDAVKWCASSLVGAYTQTSPYPPLPYRDEQFTCVIASSVFTHLARSAQEEWLTELRRLLPTGGILLASVLGEHAFVLDESHRPSVEFWASGRRRFAAVRRRLILRSAGMIDHQVDDTLNGIVPTDYYRLVYQTPAHVLRHWSKHFSVVDVVERGYHGYQDLVVLRAR